MNMWIVNDIPRTKVEKSIKRGEIYMIQLPTGVGSVQSNYRPAIILQNDVGNHFSTTTLIAPISRKRRSLPTHVELKEGIAGMLFTSYVLCEQIQTIDKVSIAKYIGKLPFNSLELRAIEASILISLGFQ